VGVQDGVQVPSHGAPSRQRLPGKVLAGFKSGVAVAPQDLGQGDARLAQRRLDGPDQGLAQQYGAATRALRPDIVHRAAWLAVRSGSGRGISWIG
jgi:hypothetical protein